MSSIGDELRRFCDVESLNPIQTARLRRIADRIDKETVELPKDADGLPIRVGDTVYLDDGRMAGVTRIDLMQDNAAVLCWASCESIAYLPTGLTHTRPDGWERIADELEAWCDRVDVGRDACGEPRALAGRIRRLAERGDGR
jgi:hypothetical protein